MRLVAKDLVVSNVLHLVPKIVLLKPHVLNLGPFADADGEDTLEPVMVDVERLQLRHSPYRRRDGPVEMVEGHVEHEQGVKEVPNRRRDPTGQPVSVEDDVDQMGPGQGGWDSPDQVVFVQ